MLAIKETVKHTIDNLLNEAVYDDIIQAFYVNFIFESGLNEIRDSKAITHEEAKKRLLKKLFSI